MRNKDLKIEGWFKKLLIHERDIATTIIDKDLVKLVKAMFARYDEMGHGYF
jgi:hypothetical protein